MELLKKYFQHITPGQEEQFGLLKSLYTEWNERINVISRKDINCLYLHHVLHSLSIAALIKFKPGTQILDVGTGGGFPGIPLAIMFPACRFTLIDSIAKKIKVVEAVAQALNLTNIAAQQQRAEAVKQSFDFVTGRAVTELSVFTAWVWGKISPNGQNALPNGIICLKGGDLSNEIATTRNAFYLSEKQISEYTVQQFFNEEYFNFKKIVYIQR
ncbi:MAG: 16S rRNA (guanine(527)-N(7))-methyltransferase RsmG [Prevotellaceae bacterium]|nr:16S rRNA (guanine(527)-N(7))-methyltransferase RsmG [Prevotellaceae bacterium]